MHPLTMTLTNLIKDSASAFHYSAFFMRTPGDSQSAPVISTLEFSRCSDEPPFAAHTDVVRYPYVIFLVYLVCHEEYQVLEEFVLRIVTWLFCFISFNLYSVSFQFPPILSIYLLTYRTTP